MSGVITTQILGPPRFILVNFQIRVSSLAAGVPDPAPTMIAIVEKFEKKACVTTNMLENTAGEIIVQRD